MTAGDALLLLLILLFYGIGDVLTTLYGMKYHNMKEGNWVHNRTFGDTMRWYQSIGAKVVTIGLVLIIYFVARIQHSSDVYQVLWWVIALAIIGQGIRVSYLNWRVINRAS